MPRIYRFKIHFVDLVLNGIIMKWKKKQRNGNRKIEKKRRRSSQLVSQRKKALIEKIFAFINPQVEEEVHILLAFIFVHALKVVWLCVLWIC